jgi:hypothetical protein
MHSSFFWWNWDLNSWVSCLHLQYSLLPPPHTKKKKKLGRFLSMLLLGNQILTILCMYASCFLFFVEICLCSEIIRYQPWRIYFHANHLNTFWTCYFWFQWNLLVIYDFLIFTFLCLWNSCNLDIRLPGLNNLCITPLIVLAFGKVP